MNGLKALVLDVDGVLTDGGVWWGPEGAEWKRLCRSDILGISLAREAGLQVALISSDIFAGRFNDDGRWLDQLAAKLGIGNVEKSCRDMAVGLRSIAGRFRLRVSDLCFMGDDVNDLGAMKIAGLSAAPANAATSVLLQAGMVTINGGGNGAVREVIEALLQARENPTGRFESGVLFGRSYDDKTRLAKVGSTARSSGLRPSGLRPSGLNRA